MAGCTINTSGIILLSLIVALAAPAQQHFDVPPNDSAANRVVLIDPGISSGRVTLLLSRSLQSESISGIPPLLFPAGTPGAQLPFLGRMNEQRADLISPLRLQMESESRLRTMQTVLGTMVVGGAAYAAYYHIKKYGLK